MVGGAGGGGTGGAVTPLIQLTALCIDFGVGMVGGRGAVANDCGEAQSEGTGIGSGTLSVAKPNG